MFNSKKRFINKYFQNKIWMEETSLDLQERFLAEARENKARIQRKIEIEEEYLARFGDSHKYEDRQKKLRSEKVLKLYQETIERQTKEIEEGLKVKDVIQENIVKFEESWSFVKGRKNKIKQKQDGTS